MKIYNEIISQFNETTQQWEDIYEDSFDHDGEIMKLDCEGPVTPCSDIAIQVSSYPGIFSEFGCVSDPTGDGDCTTLGDATCGNMWQIAPQLYCQLTADTTMWEDDGVGDAHKYATSGDTISFTGGQSTDQEEGGGVPDCRVSNVQLNGVTPCLEYNWSIPEGNPSFLFNSILGNHYPTCENCADPYYGCSNYPCIGGNKVVGTSTFSVEAPDIPFADQSYATFVTNLLVKDRGGLTNSDDIHTYIIPAGNHSPELTITGEGNTENCNAGEICFDEQNLNTSPVLNIGFTITDWDNNTGALDYLASADQILEISSISTVSILDASGAVAVDIQEPTYTWDEGSSGNITLTWGGAQLISGNKDVNILINYRDVEGASLPGAPSNQSKTLTVRLVDVDSPPIIEMWKIMDNIIGEDTQEFTENKNLNMHILISDVDVLAGTQEQDWSDFTFTMTSTGIAISDASASAGNGTISWPGYGPVLLDGVPSTGTCIVSTGSTAHLEFLFTNIPFAEIATGSDPIDVEFNMEVCDGFNTCVTRSKSITVSPTGVPEITSTLIYLNDVLQPGIPERVFPGDVIRIDVEAESLPSVLLNYTWSLGGETFVIVPDPTYVPPLNFYPLEAFSVIPTVDIPKVLINGLPDFPATDTADNGGNSFQFTIPANDNANMCFANQPIDIKLHIEDNFNAITEQTWSFPTGCPPIIGNVGSVDNNIQHLEGDFWSYPVQTNCPGGGHISGLCGIRKVPFIIYHDNATTGCSAWSNDGTDTETTSLFPDFLDWAQKYESLGQGTSPNCTGIGGGTDVLQWTNDECPQYINVTDIRVYSFQDDVQPLANTTDNTQYCYGHVTYVTDEQYNTDITTYGINITPTQIWLSPEFTSVMYTQAPSATEIKIGITPVADSMVAVQSFSEAVDGGQATQDQSFNEMATRTIYGHASYDWDCLDDIHCGTCSWSWIPINGGSSPTLAPSTTQTGRTGCKLTMTAATLADDISRNGILRLTTTSPDGATGVNDVTWTQVAVSAPSFNDSCSDSHSRYYAGDTPNLFPSAGCQLSGGQGTVIWNWQQIAGKPLPGYNWQAGDTTVMIYENTSGTAVGAADINQSIDIPDMLPTWSDPFQNMGVGYLESGLNGTDPRTLIFELTVTDTSNSVATIQKVLDVHSPVLIDTSQGFTDGHSYIWSADEDASGQGVATTVNIWDSNLQDTMTNGEGTNASTWPRARVTNIVTGPHPDIAVGFGAAGSITFTGYGSQPLTEGMVVSSLLDITYTDYSVYNVSNLGSSTPGVVSINGIGFDIPADYHNSNSTTTDYIDLFVYSSTDGGDSDRVGATYRIAVQIASANDPPVARITIM
jgi:hypothetical protein